ncbi:hypothetical protein Mal64_00830 [Pseudobythopirellula maris]|uniref:DUF1598 domain-containing protein n=1 Tax=Pseudobythopirellula maris TaxID=2527991 RepID=A0A5C5ZQC0_9BACT|nr:DUF1598 domain-containing protein [Pseudobythopirellula maris]TWT89704.1 hypothetical protein Mal64_00830 [Pseudobythopirellula maris]
MTKHKFWRTECALTAILVAAMICAAGPAAGQGGRGGGGGGGFGGGGGGGTGGQGGQGGQGGAGGAASADFDTLIDLIQSTVGVDSWAENGGGNGEIRPLTNGVYVDPGETLHRAKTSPTGPVVERPRRHGASACDPSKASELRCVSLPRLEREIARRQAKGLELDEAMLTLAGIRRVQYVFVYGAEGPDKPGDLVVAGAAGDWRRDEAGHIVSTDDDRPVVRLDDLITLLRRERKDPGSAFGCSITPRRQSLANAQQYINRSAGVEIPKSWRRRWLKGLRETVGRQDVEFFGVEPTSRVGWVLFEADHHMKLIGMGLEKGVDGVESYLDALRRERNPPADMAVLRWWFTLDYEEVRVSPEGDAYELVGHGARVLSENELLTEQGERVHTGRADRLTAGFARSFTEHYAELCAAYPIYTELRNVFDLAMVAAIIHDRGLADQAGWSPSLLMSRDRLRLPVGPTPREVDTVVSHRVVNRRNFVAGVSGGVMVKTGAHVEAQQPSNEKACPCPGRCPADNTHWWWDVAP